MFCWSPSNQTAFPEHETLPQLHIDNKQQDWLYYDKMVILTNLRQLNFSMHFCTEKPCLLRILECRNDYSRHSGLSGFIRNKIKNIWSGSQHLHKCCLRGIVPQLQSDQKAFEIGTLLFGAGVIYLYFQFNLFLRVQSVSKRGKRQLPYIGYSEWGSLNLRLEEGNTIEFLWMNELTPLV